VTTTLACVRVGLACALGLTAVSLATAARGAARSSAPGVFAVELEPRHGSGVSGTATVTRVGGHPRIVIALRRPVGVRGSLPAHLHLGSCKVQPNLDVQSSLTNVVAGRSVTLLRYTSWTELRTGTFSIHVHAPDYGVIACGNVPRSR
jgi:hypothetical protein